MGGILNAIEISSQGLSVQRARMNVVAENMANAETVQTDEGGPYRRKRVIVSEDKSKVGFRSHLSNANTKLSRTHAGHISGSRLSLQKNERLSSVGHEEIVDAESSFKLVHDPTHPLADAEGYVKMPDVEVINEMVDMMAATRAYEANTTVIASAKKMARDALDI